MKCHSELLSFASPSPYIGIQFVFHGLKQSQSVCTIAHMKLPSGPELVRNSSEHSGSFSIYFPDVRLGVSILPQAKVLGVFWIGGVGMLAASSLHIHT